MAAKRKVQKKISQKESDKAQRKTWQNELVASGKFRMKELIGIKISTLSEMVKQLEITEELKASSPHQSPPRVELSTLLPQQTPSPRKDHSTPSPQRTITTPSSSRKKWIAIKKRKASITSWNHVGRRYVIKRDDNTREMFKCISDIMELSNSDLEKIVSLGIERLTNSESARLLIHVIKERGFSVREEEKKERDPLEIIPIVSWELLGKTGKFLIIYQNGVQEYLSADRIITLVPDDLRALLKIPLRNDSNDQMGEYVKDAMHKQLDNDPDSSDKDEVAVDTEVLLAESQVPISEWYYDLVLKKFVIKRLDFTYSVFSNLVDLCVLSPTELKLLSLMPISTTTEEGT
ncbi:hypothetical protein L1987_06708 [Smallanthus sonchifolius]|uniref:Uncharacterized protein n=1 Tax=Smallanthus sonchifolius TaxID=185202 RepID=A0ACB9JZ47_9ASTR|nr:hypothetical protein L1987_06708 [Smallanthus sonchifolius]